MPFWPGKIGCRGGLRQSAAGIGRDCRGVPKEVKFIMNLHSRKLAVPYIVFSGSTPLGDVLRPPIFRGTGRRSQTITPGFCPGCSAGAFRSRTTRVTATKRKTGTRPTPPKRRRTVCFDSRNLPPESTTCESTSSSFTKKSGSKKKGVKLPVGRASGVISTSKFGARWAEASWWCSLSELP